MTIRKEFITMIKALDYNPNFEEKTLAVLFADTKEEVTGTLSIVGLPQGVMPDYGSRLITAKGELAFLDSEGTWNWVSTGGSGASLPEVTTDDNGDVLTVVEGEWSKATPTSKIVYYDITYSNSTYSLPENITIGTLLNDITNGKYVILRYHGILFTLVNDATSSDPTLRFSAVYTLSDNLRYQELSKAKSSSTSNTLTMTSKTITTS